MRLSLLLALLCCGSLVPAQLPDRCADATVIQPGISLAFTNRDATLAAGELPETLPRTCIESFENDLWFFFETQAGYGYYAVHIHPGDCDTPAGLQALLMRADGCDPAAFDYVGCANPRAVQPLLLLVRDTLPGRRYLVYVDGFDGTVCDFTLRLEVAAKDPRTRDELRLQTHDYDPPAPAADLAAFDATFVNEEVELDWTGGDENDLLFYRVMYYYADPGGVGRTLAVVDPDQSVAAGTGSSYHYVHQQPFEEGATYCYRIAKVYADGSKTYSEPACIVADLNEDFFVSPVFPGPRKGVFAVKYIVNRRLDLRFEVESSAGEIVKSLTLSKVSRGDRIMEVDMQGFAPGNYVLWVRSGAASYQRRFRVD
ncbi:MAG: hypothetical protein OHK0039_38730 [Bacteroidia bacterium]